MIEPDGDPARILDSLGLTPDKPESSRDWLHNQLNGNPLPLSGPGSHAAPDDFARVVAVILDPADGTEYLRAARALGLLIAQRPDIAAEPEAIGWHHCGNGRRYRNDDLGSPCARGTILTANRADFARLNDDARVLVLGFAALADE
jgi:hypothetical protein